MKKNQKKVHMIQKNMVVDGKLLMVFLRHAEENYNEFVADFQKEESKVLQKMQLNK